MLLPDKDLLSEREAYRCAGLDSNVPPKPLLFLDLELNEYILMSYKRPIGRTLLINGQAEIACYVVFSTAKITLLDYHFDSDGWRYRQIIPYSTIKGLAFLPKRLITAKLPTLTIKTEDSTYDLSFHLKAEELEKGMAMVKCIQKRAPSIESEIHPIDHSDKHDDLRGLMNTELNMDVKDVFKSPWTK